MITPSADRRLRLAGACLLLALACAACGPKPTDAAPAAVAAARPAAPEAAARIVPGEGVVVSIDTGRSILYMQQSPNIEMNWPAMTVGYVAAGPALYGLKAGDRIAFELQLGDGGYLLSTRRL